MKRALNQGFTLLELLVVTTVIAILAAFAMPAFNVIQDMANQTSTASNCRQIIGAMKVFANDHDSRYPDAFTSSGQATNSNDAFRVMFQKDIIQDERIFGAKASKFIPDGNIGAAPTFDQALAAGENHWAMTQGQTTKSTGIMPLVYENPEVPSWPPKWNCDAAGQRVPGRTWRDGKIIIGRNDNSVNVENLAAKSGPSVGPKALNGGQDMFTMASQAQPMQVLNIIIGGGAAYTMDPNAVNQQPGGAQQGALPTLPGAGGGLPAAPAGAGGGLPTLPPGGGLPSLPAAPAAGPAK